jgi:short subunit dehydrogenase-like uncharacterized protein
MTRNDRELDVVLFGATGFTGRLVAEHLARRHAGSGLRWALGGRRMEKLVALRDELATFDPGLGELPLIEADAFDPPSLEAMAARTRVVCATIGPYGRCGDNLVAACVATGTDYCDLTGEVPWMQRMIDAHHEAAQEAGARIVHTCGFDSIPSDLGTLLLQDHARRTHGVPCQSVDLLVIRLRGGMSGGTAASLVATVEEATTSRQARRAAVHPYALNPKGTRSGPDGRAQSGMRRDRALGTWTAPFIMATVNERVVRRTNALLGEAGWGPEFRYREASRTGPGLRGALRAAAYTAGLGGFGLAVVLPPTRKLLARFVLPAPGEGPSRETIEGGAFEVLLVGRGAREDGTSFEVRARVGADRDPGYGATAVMLGEAAVCLARDTIPDGPEGGILTPATAMGMTLVERLRATGMTFEIVGD